MTRPDADPLSAILRSLVVERAVPLLFESLGDYAMRFGAFRHLKFGAVLFGQVRLQPEVGAYADLADGDCYLLTDGRPYRTTHGPDGPEIDGTEFFATARDVDGVVRLGDGPPDKAVIGGRFVCDAAGIGWLRAALPPIVHIRAGAPQAGALRDTLHLLRDEMAAPGPGQAAVLDHLAGLLLVQAIRAHLRQVADEAAPAGASWLLGLADPRIGRAMRAFHADLRADWTVATLAAAAGMSRSSFAARFHARVGMPPMDYLSRWRLHGVRRALLAGERPFALIASEHGYRSRTSCSQSFRRLYGHAPTALRDAAPLGRWDTSSGLEGQ